MNFLLILKYRMKFMHLNTNVSAPTSQQADKWTRANTPNPRLCLVSGYSRLEDTGDSWSAEPRLVTWSVCKVSCAAQESSVD